MLDEDLGEDVDGGQSGQRDRTVTRPDQVHPEHTGQIGRAHLVHNALQRHRVQEAQQELGDDEMMFRKTFNDVFTPGDPQTALHIEELLDLVVDSEGEQRFRKLSEERLQDHSWNVDVTVLIEVHRFPLVVEFLNVLDELHTRGPSEDALRPQTFLLQVGHSLREHRWDYRLAVLLSDVLQTDTKLLRGQGGARRGSLH